MAPTLQFCIDAIQKLKDIVVACLTNACRNIISNGSRYDTSQNRKYLAKNFDNLRIVLVGNKALLRLGVHILNKGYLVN